MIGATPHQKQKPCKTYNQTKPNGDFLIVNIYQLKDNFSYSYQTKLGKRAYASYDTGIYPTIEQAKTAAWLSFRQFCTNNNLKKRYFDFYDLRQLELF